VFDAVISLGGDSVHQRWTPNAKQRIIQSRLRITEEIGLLLSRLEQKPAVFLSASAIG
jgi:hypothetical protein